jgi:hypothetical protein
MLLRDVVQNNDSEKELNGERRREVGRWRRSDE